MSSDGVSNEGEIPANTPLGEIALLFLRLGTTAFGGPAAHIAMMEEEVVRKRKWLSSERFLDLISASNLIPGPNSTELAIHIGYERAGWPGLIVAGVCFIVPATLIVLGFAWAYVKYGQLPEISSVLYGVKPVIMAIVLQALWQLSKTAIKTKLLAAVGLAVLVLSFLGVNELMLLFATGTLLGVLHWIKTAKGTTANSVFLSALLLQATATTPVAVSLTAIFLFFLKIGSVLFGSGYVLLAFLRADLVERYGWITNQQLLDAVAVGQITPGPVFTTATFIGYVIGGTSGALVATLGIFIPAFIFVAASGWLVPRLRRSPTMGAFLDGLNVASLALMAYVTFELGRSAIIDWLTILLFIISGVLLIRYKINSAWLILSGAILGFVIGFGIA